MGANHDLVVIEKVRRNNATLVGLPRDIWVHVWTFLSAPDDLWAIRAVCRAWKRAVRELVCAEATLVVRTMAQAQRLHYITQRILTGWTSVVFETTADFCLDDALWETIVQQSSEEPLQLEGNDDTYDHDHDESCEPLSWNNNNRWLPYLRHLACAQCRITTPAFLTTHLRNFFPHLVELNIRGNEGLVWSISDMVAVLPALQHVRAVNNTKARGHLSQWRPLRQTLVSLELSGCTQIQGRLADLADFDQLQGLGLDRTAVTGDIRDDIQSGSFVRLQILALDTHNMYGACAVRAVADAPAIMRARYLIARQSNHECPVFPFLLHLSTDSPDYYLGRPQQRLYHSELDPPFSLVGIRAGPRWGWRWTNLLGGDCNINWCDPEPQPSDDGFDTYISELESLDTSSSLFAGFWHPPTREEYQALIEQ